MLREEVKEHREDACWNCRLYDDCGRKWYVTTVCEKYVSVHSNKNICIDRNIKEMYIRNYKQDNLIL